MFDRRDRTKVYPRVTPIKRGLFGDDCDLMADDATAAAVMAECDATYPKDAAEHHAQFQRQLKEAQEKHPEEFAAWQANQQAVGAARERVGRLTQELGLKAIPGASSKDWTPTTRVSDDQWVRVRIKEAIIDVAEDLLDVAHERLERARSRPR